MMMSYLYCGGTESLKTNVSDLLEVRITKYTHTICLGSCVKYFKSPGVGSYCLLYDIAEHVLLNDSVS